MEAVVPAGTRTHAPADALAQLTDLVREDMARVNALILERMQSPVALIPILAGHLISAGGKRLRPMLTLAAAKAFGYGGDDHVTLATAVEFIHTATLLHDDVVDESELRRGNETANVVWGNQASVLVGDFLFSRSFQLMVEARDIRVLKILSDASAIIAEGEVMQLSAANDTATTQDTYLKVISSKTAALFAAAARVGAIVAGQGEAEEEAVRSYGENLGIAFQLVDDALDYSGQQAKLGKAVGDDFKEGKITLPIVLAVERGSEDDRSFWRRTLEDGVQNDGDLAHAIRLLEQTGSLSDTADRAREYGERARAALSQLPCNAYTQALEGIIDFCVDRVY